MELEEKQRQDVVRFIRRFSWMTGAEKARKYGGSLAVLQDRIIPLSCIARGTMQMASFRKTRGKGMQALKSVVEQLVQEGVLQEVPTGRLLSRYNSRARAFIACDELAFRSPFDDIVGGNDN